MINHIFVSAINLVDGIAVPEAFYKVVLLRYKEDGGEDSRYEARAWIVENRSYGFSGFEQKAATLELSEAGRDHRHRSVPEPGDGDGGGRGGGCGG